MKFLADLGFMCTKIKCLKFTLHRINEPCLTTNIACTVYEQYYGYYASKYDSHKGFCICLNNKMFISLFDYHERTKTFCGKIHKKKISSSSSLLQLYLNVM